MMMQTGFLGRGGRIRNVLLGLLGLLGLLLASGAAFGFTPPMEGCQVRFDAAQGSYWVYAGEPERLVAGIGMQPSADAGKIHVTIQGNTLQVDSRNFFATGQAGRSITIRFYSPDLAQVVKLPERGAAPTLTNRLIFRMKAAPEGAQGQLFFEGELDENGKDTHYWQAESFMFSGRMQDAAMERTPPHNLKKLWARFDIREPGIFSFESVTMKQTPVDTAAYDPDRNYLNNGGAELGWSDIAMANLELRKSAHDGKYVNFRGWNITENCSYDLDEQVFHSGRRSYRITAPAERSDQDFRFNMVPVVRGQSCTYTAWLKADRPNTPVQLTLFVCSGCATYKQFTVGTEWTRCEFYIPAWGSDHGEGGIIGSMQNAGGTATGMVAPGFYLHERKGTLWIDDASYFLGGKGEFSDSHRIWLRGKLDNNRHCYIAGAPVQANMELENATDSAVQGEIRYDIQNFNGALVSQSPVLKTITLAPRALSKEALRIELPPRLRGPLTLTVKVKLAGGEEESLGFYLGVLPAEQARACKRIGLEIPAALNVNLAIPYLKEFGIGAVRIGGASGDQDLAFANVPNLYNAGMSILFTTGLTHEGRDNPEKWNSYFTNLKKNIAKCRGMVDAYESQNEANIDGWSIEKNIKQIEALYRTVKEADPQAKVAGPTPCRTDFTWIDNVLRNGGAKYLDIVTEHPYRRLPELPDYANDARAVQRIINLYKPGMPHYGTEAGNVHLTQLPAGKIPEYTRLASARDIRNLIQGIAGGASRYHHFALSLWDAGSPWTCTLLGNPDNNYTPAPAPLLYGMRTFSDLIGDAAVAAQVKLGLNYRCYIFDHGSTAGTANTGKGRVAVLWKWKGAPSAMTIAPEDFQKLRVYDFGGTILETPGLEAAETPLYITSDQTVAELEQVILRSAANQREGMSVEVEPAIIAENRFALNVRNVTGKSMDAVVMLNTPGVVEGEQARTVAKIPPESAVPVEFTALKPITTQTQQLRLTVTVPATGESQNSEINLRGIIAHKVTAPLVIDGDPTDWPKNASVIHLDRTQAAGKSKQWDAKADQITTDLRYAWDNDYLYLCAVVHKPELITLTAENAPQNLWLFDSIQVCFDPLRNGSAANNQFDDDDFEYSMGLISKNPVVYRRWASSAVYDSLPKKQGVIDEVKFAVRQYDGYTVYEAAFPRRSISPFKLKEGETMRTSMIANLNNGAGRIGYLELTPGIGESKTPGLWMDLVLRP